MTTETIAIIGATGKTGARVQQRLTQLGYSPRALSRQSSPAFDWTAPDGWREALKGVDAVYITYQPDLAVPAAAEDISNLIAAAKHAGVKHLVLLSGRGEEGAQQAEAQISNSELDWNVVRASWFMQNFSESFMLDGILARQLVLPEAKAKEPFIDVEDIADVVVAALTRKELRNQLFEVTGPEILSFDNCVDTISHAVNQPIHYQPIPLSDYLQAATADGMPEPIAWLMQELFSEVLDGRNAYITDTVEQVLGRPARRFTDYVQATVKSGVWRGAS